MGAYTYLTNKESSQGSLYLSLSQSVFIEKSNSRTKIIEHVFSL